MLNQEESKEIIDDKLNNVVYSVLVELFPTIEKEFFKILDANVIEDLGPESAETLIKFYYDKFLEFVETQITENANPVTRDDDPVDPGVIYLAMSVALQKVGVNILFNNSEVQKLLSNASDDFSKGFVLDINLGKDNKEVDKNNLENSPLREKL